MTDKNDREVDRLDLDEAKRCVRCMPLAIPDESVCESVSKVMSGLIQEVERLRGEIENNRFVDDMLELADMMEVVTIKPGGLVTESLIRNTVKDHIESLNKELAERTENYLDWRSAALKKDEIIKELEAENAELKAKVEELSFLLNDARDQRKIDKENPF